MMRKILRFLGLVAIAFGIVGAGYGVLFALEARGFIWNGGPSVEDCGSSEVRASLRRIVSNAYNAQAWTTHLEMSDISVSSASALSINREVRRVECDAWIDVSSPAASQTVRFQTQFSVADNLAHDGEFSVQLNDATIPYSRLGSVARPGTDQSK